MDPAPAPAPPAEPVLLPHDVMPDIVYASFRLHGGELAKTMWLTSRGLWEKMKPANNARLLIHRQNNLGTVPAGSERQQQFEADLAQLAHLPAPLRVLAFAALAGSARQLPADAQPAAFFSLLSAVPLLPGPDRAAALQRCSPDLVPAAFRTQAVEALCAFLQTRENWGGSEEVIGVVLRHVPAKAAKMLEGLIAQVGRVADPHALSSALLGAITAIPDADQVSAPHDAMEALHEQLVLRLAPGPARLEWLRAAADMLQENSLSPSLPDRIASELKALAAIQPVNVLVRGLLDQRRALSAMGRASLVGSLYEGVAALPASDAQRAAWDLLVGAAIALPDPDRNKARLPNVIAGDLCRTLSGPALQEMFRRVCTAARRALPCSCLFGLQDVQNEAAAGIARMDSEADRIAAFDTLFATVGKLAQEHEYGALRALAGSVGTLPASVVRHRVESIVDRAMDQDCGLSYRQQAAILSSISLIPKVDGAAPAIDVGAGTPDIRESQGFLQDLESSIVALNEKIYIWSIALANLARAARNLPEPQPLQTFKRILHVFKKEKPHLQKGTVAVVLGVLDGAAPRLARELVLAVTDLVADGYNADAFLLELSSHESPLQKLGVEERGDIAAAMLQRFARVAPALRHAFLSTVLAIARGAQDTVDGALFDAWSVALYSASPRSSADLALLARFAGQIGVQLKGEERAQAIRKLVAQAFNTAGLHLNGIKGCARARGLRTTGSILRT